MKIPNVQIVKDVANYYDIPTKGRFIKWLKLMNKNARVYYYTNEYLQYVRVNTLLHQLGCNVH